MIWLACDRDRAASACPQGCHQATLQAPGEAAGDRVDQSRMDAADSSALTLKGRQDHCLLLAFILPEMGPCESGLRHSVCVIFEHLIKCGMLPICSRLAHQTFLPVTSQTEAMAQVLFPPLNRLCMALASLSTVGPGHPLRGWPHCEGLLGCVVIRFSTMAQIPAPL